LTGENPHRSGLSGREAAASFNFKGYHATSLTEIAIGEASKQNRLSWRNGNGQNEADQR
jgi:hypothetical protein